MSAIKHFYTAAMEQLTMVLSEKDADQVLCDATEFGFDDFAYNLNDHLLDHVDASEAQKITSNVITATA